MRTKMAKLEAYMAKMRPKMAKMRPKMAHKRPKKPGARQDQAQEGLCNFLHHSHAICLFYVAGRAKMRNATWGRYQLRSIYVYIYI